MLIRPSGPSVDREQPGGGVSDRTPRVVFADLAGYTALTEAHGDDGAADVALRFFDLTARNSGPMRAS